MTMKSRESAFTLIELLVTVAIIGMLVALMAPNLSRARDKAMSVKCANNLRQIGIAVLQYANDNDNRFPKIEGMPSNPIYEGDTGEAKPMEEVLGPYGVTKATLQCPSDLARNNYYKTEGSSYQWNPVVDEELVSSPKFYSRMGVRNPRSSWIRLAMDFDTVHAGHSNRLYADGHVKAN